MSDREEHVTDWLEGMPQPARALYAFDPEFVAWVRHGARLAAASDTEVEQGPATREQVVKIVVHQGKAFSKKQAADIMARLRREGPHGFV